MCVCAYYYFFVVVNLLYGYWIGYPWSCFGSSLFFFFLCCRFSLLRCTTTGITPHATDMGVFFYSMYLGIVFVFVSLVYGSSLYLGIGGLELRAE